MELQIKTNYGIVEGIEENGIRVFKGIPYAKDYSGIFRFKTAKPADAWDGIKKCTNFGPVLHQMPKKYGGVQEGTPMSEEGLCLNIWAPELSDEDRVHPLPVMFWIYGGAYATGDGGMDLYNGTNLAKYEHVIIVNFNYRVNAFGFLDLSSLDSDFEANVGMKDELLALKWVYENIDQFGGDKDNITIWGQSAGANSVTTLLMMPSARPYIAKAYALSSYPAAVNSKEFAAKNAVDFLEILKIDKRDIKKLLDIPADKLVWAAKELELKRSAEFQNRFAFLPVIDGELIPEHPMKAVQKNIDNKIIPLIMGTANNEASLYANNKIPLFTSTKESITAMFNYYEDKEPERSLSRVRTAYSCFPSGMQFQYIGGDGAFRIPSMVFADAYSRRNPVWFYRFCYKTAFLTLKKLYSMHGSDVPFVFNNLSCSIGRIALMLTPFRAKPNRLAGEMSHMAADFARSGKANWVQYTDKQHSVRIWDGARTATIESDSIKDAFEAWKSTTYFTKTMI